MGKIPQYREQVKPSFVPSVKPSLKTAAMQGAGMQQFGQTMADIGQDWAQALKTARVADQYATAKAGWLDEMNQFQLSLNKRPDYENYAKEYAAKVEELNSKYGERITERKAAEAFNQWAGLEAVQRKNRVMAEAMRKEVGHMRMNLYNNLDRLAKNGEKDNIRSYIESALTAGYISREEAEQKLPEALAAADFHLMVEEIQGLDVDTALQRIEEAPETITLQQRNTLRQIAIQRDNWEKRKADEAREQLREDQLMGLIDKIATDQATVDYVVRETSPTGELSALTTSDYSRVMTQLRAREDAIARAQEERRYREGLNAYISEAQIIGKGNIDELKRRVELSSLERADKNFVNGILDDRLKADGEGRNEALEAEYTEAWNLYLSDPGQLADRLNDSSAFPELNQPTIEATKYREHFQKLLEQDKAGAGKDPNTISDSDMFLRMIQMREDPTVSPEEYRRWLLDNAGMDPKTGEPRVSLQDADEELRGIENRKPNYALDQAVKVISGTFSDLIKDEKDTQKRTELRNQQAEISREILEDARQGNWTPEQIEQAVTNRLYPFKERKILGIFQTGRRKERQIEEAVEEGRFFGMPAEEVYRTMYREEPRGTMQTQDGRDVVITQNGQYLLWSGEEWYYLDENQKWAKYERE